MRLLEVGGHEVVDLGDDVGAVGGGVQGKGAEDHGGDAHEGGTEADDGPVAGEEALDDRGGVHRRQRAQQRPRLSQLGLGLPARCARLQVGGDLGRRLRVELAVDVGREPVLGVVAPHASASRSASRPRWMRLRTVPTGTSSCSAISA